jgi:predicted SAM-dependent methyltransferase
MLLFRLYKKIPLRHRDRLNLIRHRVNSNKALLKVTSRVRHKLTMRYLGRVTEPFRLRLGESRKFEGWISTNYQVFCRHLLDATRPFKVRPGASFIVIDNVIEHLPLSKGISMLENIFDCLNPGGVLRIATPNLKNIALMYLNPNFLEIENFKKDFIAHGIEIRYPADLLKATFNHFGHQTGYIYDEDTLSQILTDLGFIDIKPHLPGESDIPALQLIESRVGNSDKWGQLCLEAMKPKLVS